MKHDFLWEKGIPQYGLDHDYITKEIKDFENKNKDLHIMGNYVNGISVSDCIEKASILSKRL
jgi:protoporphyrinogen oxidase